MSPILAGPYAHVGGYCWSLPLSASDFPGSDDVTDASRSCLLVKEDGRELGPPHTSHQLLIQDGGGAYSHWRDVLWFSTSDNSSPNDNGRAYSVEIDEARYFDRRVDYAVDTVNSWARWLPGGLAAFRARDVLEIGPGRDMGTALLIAALGARRVCAVDRFTGAWRDGWHDRFIGKLRGALDRLGTETDPATLDAALASRRLDVAPIRFIAGAFETMVEAADAFDLSVSHSTFEHFYSVEQAAQALSAGTRTGGVGVHDVDFRDHANFGEPLKFLLIDEATYADPAINNDYGRGNRIRADEMGNLLRQAGFGEVSFHPGMQADPAYVDGLLGLLPGGGIASSDERKAGLRTLSGTFVLRK
jgi:hypothetical protein